MPTLLRKAVAEAVGTFLLVLFGTGVVASAITTGAQQGLWQVAAVWGFGIALSIFATAGVSGAHLNPAVTVAFAIWRPSDMPWNQVPAYVAGQLAGAVAASAVVLAVWGSALNAYEEREGIDRDGANGVRTAAAFGEYVPCPRSQLSPSRPSTLRMSTQHVAQSTCPILVAQVLSQSGGHARRRRGNDRWCLLHRGARHVHPNVPHSRAH